MNRVILLAVLLALTTVMPGRAQDQDPRPTPGQREITIPSEKTFERDAVTSPKNDFSTNDATATQQMERQNRWIDRKIMNGICTEC